MAAEPTSQPADAAPAHAGASTEAAQSGGGLPQFKFEFWGGQIVWLLLIFAVLYTLLAKVFVPRLRKILDVRAETIASAVEQAKAVQAEADAQAAAAKAEIDQARAASRALAADAKAKATAELNKRQAAEDARLAGELAQAEDRIRGLRDAAMSNVNGIAVETAQAIVERLTGAKVTAADIKSAARAGQGAV
jgi:F-type H+-transporting ATPase subunit b